MSRPCRSGGIQRDPNLNFPKPSIINGKPFTDLNEVDEFMKSLVLAASGRMPSRSQTAWRSIALRPAASSRRSRARSLTLAPRRWRRETWHQKHNAAARVAPVRAADCNERERVRLHTSVRRRSPFRRKPAPNYGCPRILGQSTAGDLLREIQRRDPHTKLTLSDAYRMLCGARCREAPTNCCRGEVQS